VGDSLPTRRGIQILHPRGSAIHRPLYRWTI
jgi:hypothetical protein